MNDKLKHFIAGTIIASIVLVACLLIFGTDKRGSDIAILAAFISALVAGIGKELYDKHIRKTMFDIYDLVATWVGFAVPMIVWGVLMNFI